MKFGPVPLDAAEGAVLAHALTLGGLVLKKGRILSACDIGDLAALGATEVIAARFEPGDIAEDAAVARIGAALAGPGLTAAPAFTGRCNLHAEAAGVLVLDRAAIERLNRIDESITLATLAPFALVEPGQMAATIKLIPFAATEAIVAAWERAAVRLRVTPFIAHRVALVQTLLPGIKASVLEKGALLTDQRVAALGSALVAETRCAHRAADVAGAIAGQIAAGAELVLVAGASAIVDRRDVIPAAITAAGGTIEHFGMPVDPGNLLLIGRIGAVPVLGLPGCARSPKLNGLDWVLQRLLAKLPVGPDEIMAMGVGGLLADPARPRLPAAQATAATGIGLSPLAQSRCISRSYLVSS